jgi:hypothetical protein
MEPRKSKREDDTDSTLHSLTDLHSSASTGKIFGPYLNTWRTAVFRMQEENLLVSTRKCDLSIHSDTVTAVSCSAFAGGGLHSMCKRK